MCNFFWRNLHITVLLCRQKQDNLQKKDFLDILHRTPLTHIRQRRTI